MGHAWRTPWSDERFPRDQWQENVNTPNGSPGAAHTLSTIRIGNFEWDSVKAASNVRKHGVTFDEAASCFLDPHGQDLADRVHPDRFVLIAYSASSRALAVVYAERAEHAIIRIISARKATPHEKALYQDES